MMGDFPGIELENAAKEIVYPKRGQPHVPAKGVRGYGPRIKGGGLNLGTMITLPNTQIEPSGDPGYRKQVPEKPSKWYHHIFGAPRKEVFVDQFGNPLQG
jgi:hypothetical protein